MKNLIVKFGIGLILVIQTSCITGYQRIYPFSENSGVLRVGYINPVPIVKHDNHIPLFVDGEKPKKPYIKMATLEVTNFDATAYGEMMQQVRQKAREIGADGVMILGKKHTSDAITDIDGDVDFYIREKHLSAIAIKYTDNVKEYEQYPKKETYYAYNRKEQQYDYHVINLLDMHGNISEREKHNGYERNTRIHSLKFLLEEQNDNWQDFKKDGLLVKRKYFDGLTNRTYTYQYTYDSLNKVINILDTDRKIDIEVVYNDVNQVVQKKIYSKRPISKKNKKGKYKTVWVDRGLTYTENLKYDAQGRFIEKEINRISNTGEAVPWIKIVYSDFYTLEDVQALSSENYIER